MGGWAVGTSEPSIKQEMQLKRIGQLSPAEQLPTAQDLLEKEDASWQQKEEKGHLRIPEGFCPALLFCSFVSCLLYKKWGAPVLGAGTHVQ